MAGIAEAGLPRYIVVEGPIGVGKTTLVEQISRRIPGSHTILEIYEENPFLPQFYQDPDRYAFQTEMFFLLSRYRQQESFAQTDLFARLSVSDYLFVKSRLFASLTLDDHELSLYDKLFIILSQQVPRPDVVVHLQAPLETLQERIAQRGRDYEQQIEPGYLERLGSLYHNFFAHYEDAPLVEVDTTQVDLRHDEQAVDDLLGQIASRHQQATAPRPAVQF